MKWQYAAHSQCSGTAAIAPDYISFLASCTSLCTARFGHFQFLQFIYYFGVPPQCGYCRILHEMPKKKIFWSGEENVVAKEGEAEISLFEVRMIWKLYWFIICILLPLLFLSELTGENTDKPLLNCGVHNSIT